MRPIKSNAVKITAISLIGNSQKRARTFGPMHIFRNYLPVYFAKLAATTYYRLVSSVLGSAPNFL
jgi:hypothetical protein